jgi:hypothetical protein
MSIIRRPSRIPGLRFVYTKDRFPYLSLVHAQSGMDIFRFPSQVTRPAEMIGVVERAFAAVPFDWNKPVEQLDLIEARAAVDQAKRRLAECVETVEVPKRLSLNPVWRVKERCRFQSTAGLHRESLSVGSSDPKSRHR